MEEKMNKIRRKLTAIIIILLGLLITTPALFADPAPVHRRRPMVRQEMVRRQHRRWNLAGVLNRLHRPIRRKQIGRQVRRNVYRRMNREQARNQQQCNNYHHQGHNRQ